MKSNEILYKYYNDPQEYKRKDSDESVYCFNMAILNAFVVTYNFP